MGKAWTHQGGLSASPEYGAWQNMKLRCLKPNHPQYHNYGARGISIHPEWIESFAAFLQDVGLRPSPQHSLERIDVDGNYEPGNVTWETAKAQARNRRSSLRIAIDGEVKSLPEWAAIYGLSRKTIEWRIKNGWDPAKAVITPRKAA